MAPFAAAETAQQESEQFPAGMKLCGTGKAAAVLSGDRFQLKDGGIVSLAEIKAPEYWPPGAPYKSWPMSLDAKTALTSMLQNETLEFFCSGKARSAEGALLAHVRTSNGQWVQFALVKAGYAFFMPHGQRPKLASRLRTAEAAARAQRRRIWSHESLGVKTADGDGLRPGWFQIIIGNVTSEEKRKDRTYLNFGDDWSRDFTIEIPRRLYRRLSKITDRHDGFLGKTIEVRGWVEWAGGPKIILEFADQLTIVPDRKVQSR